MTVTLSNVSKSYRLKTVLKNLTLTLQSGKVHALLGENGAGKSTLASILSGKIKADDGTIFFDEKPHIFHTPKDAIKNGIICVEQTPLLAENLTVKENILLGLENSFSKINKKIVLQNAKSLFQKIAPHIFLNTKVLHLGGNERFYLAFVSSLLRNPKFLILDEPASLLDEKERNSLYSIIKELAQKGITILIITHITKNICSYTDTITILEDGVIKKTYNPSSTFLENNYTQNDFSKINNIEQNTNRKSKMSAQYVLQNNCSKITFSNLTARPKKMPSIFDISFSAFSNEITLIQGLPESGLTTLENVLCGMKKTKTLGNISFNFPTQKKNFTISAQKMNSIFLRKNINSAIIPSNRTFRGSSPSLSILQLVGAMFSKNKIQNDVEKIIKEADVKISPNEKASSLSGGMLQKLIFGRELSSFSPYVIACEPLQGLDTKAVKRTILLLQKCAKEGAVVLILSSSFFPEEICTQVYKLTGGKLICKKKFLQQKACYEKM